MAQTLDVLVLFVMTGHNFITCRCGTNRRQDTKKSYVNLMSHIREARKEYEEVLQEKEKNSSMFSVTDKAQNLYGWLDSVNNGGFLFSLVEKKVIHKYVKLEPIDLKTFSPKAD